MRRLVTMLAALLLTALSMTTAPAYADDGSGCRTDGTYIEQIYGDTAR